ncbi:MAG: penicillin-insensitive murein endopeptidase [Hyphomicrobium sp.]|jgi:penicillin-insensitive murein endopeptidase
MQRTHFLSLIGSLCAISFAAAAEPSPTGQPAVKVPAPVQAKRLPATTPSPAPAPQQKSATPASDKSGADKKAAGKKEKEKKPKVLARTLFGKAETASALAPRALGWYSKGCLSGGVHLADTGPDWQAMRLSRNRAWGHPKLIKLLKRFASESKQDGWTGLLVGDISQPRGGPMLTGHASHQVGLDADIWLTPMPNRVLSRKEREEIQATTMLDSTSLAVDPKVFTPAHVAIIKRAASYPQVERIFVNPAIKKALCQAAGKDRAWLGKVRPIWGHNYHFHIRIGCPNGGCQVQPPVSGDDGCGSEVTNWLKTIEASLKKAQPKPGVKIIPDSERRQVTMEQLPAECKVVLNSPGSKRDLSDEVAATPTGSTDAK